MSTNLVGHEHKVSKVERQNLLKQKSPVIWLTGLSGSGKSTIANELSIKLHKEGKLSYILDGDNVRMGLNKDLGFSDNDRKENIRRISEVAKLLSLNKDATIIHIKAKTIFRQLRFLLFMRVIFFIRNELYSLVIAL